MAAERRTVWRELRPANNLTERLRRRLESERREIEELTASELARLAEDSRCVARNVLNTIERDTEQATGRMRELLFRAWLRPFVVGMGLWLGIFGGGWATMRWLSGSIQARIERITELDYDIDEARWTLAQSWRWTLRASRSRDRRERIVVLPAGTLDHTGGTWRDRPAVKLSNK